MIVREVFNVKVEYSFYVPQGNILQEMLRIPVKLKQSLQSKFSSACKRENLFHFGVALSL